MPAPVAVSTYSGTFTSSNPNQSGNRLWRSPTNTIRSIRSSRGARTNYDTVQYVTTFDPITKESRVYRQTYNVVGQANAINPNELIATRNAEGRYEPSNWARQNLPASVVQQLGNDGSVKNSLDTNLRYTVQGGFKAQNGKNATPTDLQGLLGGAAEDSTPANPGNPNSGGDGSTQATLTSDNNSSIPSLGKQFQGSVADLVYPITSTNESTDYVVFQALTYGKASASSTGFGFNRGKNDPSGGTKVYLPIQGTIADSNGVGWNEETMNPLQIAGAAIATETIGGGLGAGFQSVIDMLGKVKNNNSDIKTAITAIATESAIGANILPRLERAIFNPNTELLFQGPQLRGFNFTFKLTPRSAPESARIKEIIKFFKKNMAAKATGNELYLKAPNVFSIKYKHKGAEHSGINLINDCALQSFSVDYTPDGSYMAYADGGMFSYTITMQFMELLPIYFDDYDKTNHPIGY